MGLWFVTRRTMAPFANLRTRPRRYGAEFGVSAIIASEVIVSVVVASEDIASEDMGSEAADSVPTPSVAAAEDATESIGTNVVSELSLEHAPSVMTTPIASAAVGLKERNVLTIAPYLDGGPNGIPPSAGQGSTRCVVRTRYSALETSALAVAHFPGFVSLASTLTASTVHTSTPCSTKASSVASVKRCMAIKTRSAGRTRLRRGLPVRCRLLSTETGDVPMPSANIFNDGLHRLSREGSFLEFSGQRLQPATQTCLRRPFLIFSTSATWR